MPIYHAPIRDYQFLLKEFLPLADYPQIYGEHLDLISPLLDEGAKFCENILFPLNQIGDSEGCKFENGDVTLPSGFADAYKQYCQSGWTSFSCNEKYGGQGLPEALSVSLTEMVCSSNLSFGLIAGLSHGAYHAISLHGTEAVKDKYLPHLANGEYTGVMCLTEAGAGTDLGLINTKAEYQGDLYSITGSKIFISCGEHDAAENILHLILARLPNAPAGIKGISLFLVPKLLDNKLNGVICTGLEEKMGIHASPTCSMSYEGAKGYLLGKENQGLKAMFTMMNTARIYVGIQGLGLAETAYQNAYEYAKERLQGRALKNAKYPNKKADPIIVHAEIKRNLLTMKAFIEGSRALAMLAMVQNDIALNSEGETHQNADDFVQLMTPIIKSYLTDGGFETANMAMQIYGGHGYIKEYGIEQYVRDARIAQIYEGTNGVQALDLIGRKLSYKYGRYLRSFFHPATEFIAKNKSAEMVEFIRPLSKAMEQLQTATGYMAKAGLANPEDAAAGAVEYLRIFSLTVMAWIWAKQARIALDKISSGNDVEFYEDKLCTARFFMARVLPQIISLLICLTKGSESFKIE